MESFSRWLASSLICLAISSSTKVVAIGSLPEISNPTIAELKALELVAVEKDPYETTAEYQARKAKLQSTKKETILFVPLEVSFDADTEAYSISDCSLTSIANTLKYQEQNGVTSGGAEWAWTEITDNR